MRRPTPAFIFMATGLAILVMLWMVTTVSAVSVPVTAAPAPTLAVEIVEAATPYPTEVLPEIAVTQEPFQVVPEASQQEAAEFAEIPVQPQIPVVEQVAPVFEEPVVQEAANNLEQFASAITDGQPGVLRGVFAPGRFAFQIVQQPADDNNFVSYDQNTVTQFQAASQHGVVGLLAHNTRAGMYFDELTSGDTIYLVYGDGKNEAYQIQDGLEYQALQPESPASDFIDLANGQMMTSGDVFYNIYSGSHALVLQTCIEQNGNTEWGRLFLTAHRVPNS